MSDQQDRTPDKKIEKKSRKRRTILWIALAVVLLILIVLALLPSLLSTSPGRRMVLSNINNKINGKMTVADWSLGWFSGFRMSSVALEDAEGRPAAQVALLNLPATVPTLLSGKKNLGTIEVVSPRLDVIVYEDGTTNIQRILEPLSKGPKKEPGELGFDVSGNIVVSDGQIIVKPENAAEAVTVNDFNAEMNIESLSQPIDLTASAKLGSSGAPLGINGSITPMHNGVIAPEELEGTISMTLAGLELSEFSALARTFGAPVDVAGKVDVVLKAQLAGLKNMSAMGEVTAAGMQMSGGPLGEDRPRFENASLRFDLLAEDQRIKVRALEMDSPVMRANAQGWVAPATEGKLPEGDLTLRMDGDLAAMAALMPHTLKLQEGLTVTGGTVKVNGALSSQNGIPRLESLILLEGLAADRNGQSVSLEEPIRMEFAASQPPEGLNVERFTMQSSFARANGSGNLSNFTLEMSSDLSAVTAEAGKFIDLQGSSMSGIAKMTLGVTATEDDRRKLEGLMEINGLSVTGLTPQPVQIDRITSEIKALAVIGQAGQQSALENLSVTFVSPLVGAAFKADRILSSTVAGLPITIENGVISVNADMQDIVALANGSGALGTPLDAAGQISLISSVKVEGESIILDPKIQGTALRYTQGEKSFNEQLLRVTGHIQAHPGKRMIEATNFSAQTSFGELRVTRAMVSDWADPFAKPLSANIEGAVQLDQLRQAAGGFLALPPDTVIKGRADFQFNLTAASTATTNFRAALADLHIERPGFPPVDEPQVVVTGVADVELAAERADLRSFSLESSFLQLAAAGSITEWGSQMLVDISGEMTPDWQAISPLASTFLGSPVELQGRQTKPFSLRAPLAETDTQALLRAMNANLQLGLDSANVKGISLAQPLISMVAEAGKASVDVTGGLLEGTMNLPLRLDATGDQAVATLPDETVILKDIHINDAFADTFLSKVSPVFSRSINTAGVIGLTSHRFHSPLDPMLLSDAAAEMDLGLNGVTLSSEGFLGQILALAGMGETMLMQMPEQQVAISLENGRIRQGPMALVFADYTMTLSGIMGLDGTLDMAAEIPVTPNMVPDENIYELLKDEKLRVPVTGTVQEPIIASNIVKENLNGLVRSAGQKLLQREGGKIIERGLENIFK